MADKYLLGVDIGTYESKGVITTLTGEVVSTQVSPHELDIPHQGWAEHDPEKVWWGDFVTITQRLLEDSGVSPDQIAAVGVSSIGPDVLPVDEEANPLREGAILYGVDTRAADEIVELNEKIGEDRIFAMCGNTLSAQSTGPKILWLKRHEPEVYKRAHKFVTGTSFIVARLTGNFVVDHLTGSFVHPLYDLEKRCYTSELTDEIAELERLPELRWTTDIAGYVTAKAAAQTGLAEGTPVITGTADAPAEAVSVGVVSHGQLMLMYGSTVFMIEVVDRPVKDERLWSTPFLFPGTSAIEAGMATSGSLTRWFRDKLAADLVQAELNGELNAYSELTREATEVPPGSEGLVVLPYFSGERTPINDPRARGVIFGLTLAHSRAHIFRAILEGISYGIAHHFDVMEQIGAKPRQIMAVGGGTKSPLWLQAVSDVTQMPQHVPAVTTGASYGDAFLAGLGVGLFESYHDINKWLRDIRTVEPNPETAELYRQYYEVYLELYRRNKDLMHRVRELA
ncbi:MAG: FGGY-family carbohydrate kinase [Chloroflexi bacterium]|nr:FGGY-family carbohydrate kinase [Chloroflexota bacterium]